MNATRTERCEHGVYAPSGCARCDLSSTSCSWATGATCNCTNELTREELLDLLDFAKDEGRMLEASMLQARLRTVCSHCGRDGAEDYFDREDIYAGRWHERCMTAADRHLVEYRWTPGDEPLEEEA